ncbi:DUF2635 domain-containing protein [Snodgrassella communis]|uniref:DUF2635 domain-containing protein n=1 Tax=Snodgrassella communis TaxID=2946699 RepID=UPI001EF6CE9B|nr:DUF2635 domain-containing protein [Snodgrassella communis]
MKEKMLVQAADGLRVPKENRANSYITNNTVKVPDSLYYRCSVTDGDLTMVTENLNNETGVKE